MEDLLDLRLMQEGTFTLQNDVFDVNETFDLIHNIFGQEAMAKNVLLESSIGETLRRP